MASRGRTTVFLPCTSPDPSLVDEKHRHAIQAAFSDRTQSSRSDTDRINLVLLVTGLAEHTRSTLFSFFQKLVANTYTLVGIVAAECNADLDFPGGFDVRVYAVDAGVAQNDASNMEMLASISGPLTTLASFHDSGVASVSEKDLATLPSIVAFEKVAGESNQPKSHYRVAVGGTFDHLHIGHKLLLTLTIFIAQPSSEGREITIGITGDELLVKKKHASVLESWDIRQQRSADFVESILVFHSDVASIRTIEHEDKPGPNGKVVKVTYDTGKTGKITINYVRISDPFGPTITDESITALIISAETRAGGKAVNDKRNEQGWASLEVFEVDVLDPSSVSKGAQAISTSTTTDFATKISSTEIRRRLETIKNN